MDKNTKSTQPWEAGAARRKTSGLQQRGGVRSQNALSRESKESRSRRRGRNGGPVRGLRYIEWMTGLA